MIILGAIVKRKYIALASSSGVINQPFDKNDHHLKINRDRCSIHYNLSIGMVDIHRSRSGPNGIGRRATGSFLYGVSIRFITTKSRGELGLPEYNCGESVNLSQFKLNDEFNSTSDIR